MMMIKSNRHCIRTPSSVLSALTKSRHLTNIKKQCQL
jgi:hypothetical protein